MGYELNFGLLGAPVNVGDAVQAGYQHGRQLRQQGQQERAFSLLAHDPNSPAGLALLTESGRPDLAHQFHEWGKEDRRDAYARAAFGGPTVAPAGTSAAFPAANGPAVPAGTAPGAMPVASAMPQPPASAPAASPAPGELNPQLMRQWYMEDPEGARQFQTGWAAMNTAQRAQQTQRFTAAVPILSELARMPVAQRAAALAGQSDFLVSNGWTQDQIQHFAADPSDDNIRMLLRIGVPLAEQHQFFAPTEAAPGAVGRDPVTNDVIYANPTQPHTEIRYDAAGNQVPVMIPGTPAIGPGAARFGSEPAAVNLIQPGTVVNGFRYRGPAVPLDDPQRRNPNNWERVGEGGAGQPQASSTFPRQDAGAFDFSLHPAGG